MARDGAQCLAAHAVLSPHTAAGADTGRGAPSACQEQPLGKHKHLHQGCGTSYAVLTWTRQLQQICVAVGSQFGYYLAICSDLHSRALPDLGECATLACKSLRCTWPKEVWLLASSNACLRCCRGAEGARVPGEAAKIVAHAPARGVGGARHHQGQVHCSCNFCDCVLCICAPSRRGCAVGVPVLPAAQLFGRVPPCRCWKLCTSSCLLGAGQKCLKTQYLY